MALIESIKLPLGSDIIDFKLQGTDERTYQLQNFESSEILIIIFTCNHCPYAKASWPILMQLQEHFKNKSVQFIAINPNDTINYPEDSFENMQKHKEEMGITFLYLIDETQKVAKTYKAQCTPDIYVFNKERKLKYHGRINDNWQEPKKVTHEDLKEAIESLLQGNDPSKDQIPSIGCSIKWKETRGMHNG